MPKIIVVGRGLNKTRVCRFCVRSKIPMVDLFAFKHKSNVVDMISKCTSVTITKSDDMPNFICCMCRNQLIRTHRFQRQALKSDKILRSYLQQLCTADSQTKNNSYQQPHATKNNEMSMDFDTPQLNIKEEISTNVSIENSKTIAASIKQEKDTEQNSFYSETVWLNSAELKHDEDVKVAIKEELIYQEFEDSEATQDNLKSESTMTGSAYYNPCHLDQTEDSIKVRLNTFQGYDNDVNLEGVNSKQINLDKSSHLDVNYTRNDGMRCFPVDLSVSLQSNSSHVDKNDDSSILTNTPECLPITEQGEKLIKCDLCDKCFSNMTNLNKHKREHAGEKPYPSNFCETDFSQTDLKFHEETPFQYDDCDESSVRSNESKANRQTHCEFCGKYFCKISNLKRHERIHTGERPYRCDVCNRTFIQMADLTSHKLRHTGEKPFKCDFCDKGFVRSINLKLHRRIHTGEKPYKCDVCDATFSDSSNLKRHKRKHSDKKVYQCDVCLRLFTRVQALKQHQSTHRSSLGT